jgi:hypothetical protein
MVALMLTVIALFSVYDSAAGISPLGVPPGIPFNPVSVTNTLLLTITIIVLFGTVTVCFRTKNKEARAHPVAGPAGIVRHIPAYTMADIDPMTMIATVALLAVLIGRVGG